MAAKKIKLWGGRFQKPTNPIVESFSSSISFDNRLARYDVLGSIAHAQMLGACKIIPSADSKAIVGGLSKILRLIENDKFEVDAQAEDIHTQIQQELSKLIGKTAEKLHTARSRNDQVATDLRMYCRDAQESLIKQIKKVQRGLLELADKNRDLVIAGYTHLQQAQPILLSHQLLAYVESLERDKERLKDAAKRVNVLPLGSGALAGTSLPIDRRYVAKQLGFPKLSDNSLDAVSDRDFAMELLSSLSILSVHLSRLSEDFILWATDEFGILELDDSFATGSSLMPQKKNPDVLELIRGHAGIVIGSSTALLSLMKGLPLSYNRDMQWDKLILFPALDGTTSSLSVLEKLLKNVSFRKARIEQIFKSDTICATDLAEYLVQKGCTSREAHEAVGKAVVMALRRGCNISDIKLTELKNICPGFDEEAKSILNARRSVELKQSHGGTSPQNVKQAISSWRKKL
jgi:argininosuccinate lyase